MTHADNKTVMYNAQYCLFLYSLSFFCLMDARSSGHKYRQYLKQIGKVNRYHIKQCTRFSPRISAQGTWIANLYVWVKCLVFSRKHSLGLSHVDAAKPLCWMSCLLHRPSAKENRARNLKKRVCHRSYLQLKELHYCFHPLHQYIPFMLTQKSTHPYYDHSRVDVKWSS
jgi:hypothetical protein